jgi:viroplasmin and RNaseH domain-containing protein
MFTAQPNLNNTIGAKQFETREQAVAYLEEKTGFEMAFEVDQTKKKRLIKQGYTSKQANQMAKTYDWELIGKLYVSE